VENVKSLATLAAATTSTHLQTQKRRELRRERICREIEQDGFYFYNNSTLVDYVPDFDAPNYDVDLFLTVACRHRGLDIAE
jgi:hypothetical protein